MPPVWRRKMSQNWGDWKELANLIELKSKASGKKVRRQNVSSADEYVMTEYNFMNFIKKWIFLWSLPQHLPIIFKTFFSDKGQLLIAFLRRKITSSSSLFALKNKHYDYR
jgi:hypothetical protein